MNPKLGFKVSISRHKSEKFYFTDSQQRPLWLTWVLQLFLMLMFQAELVDFKSQPCSVQNVLLNIYGCKTSRKSFPKITVAGALIKSNLWHPVNERTISLVDSGRTERMGADIFPPPLWGWTGARLTTSDPRLNTELLLPGTLWSLWGCEVPSLLQVSTSHRRWILLPTWLVLHCFSSLLKDAINGTP